MAHYTSTRIGGEETLYHVGGNGNKSKVYTTRKDGSVEIHDPNDPKAQELIAQREYAKMLQEKAAERDRQRRQAQEERDARIMAVKMVAFVVEATVRSNYLSKDVYTIEEKDNFFFNERVLKRSVERINDVITKTIGRNIPADRKRFL